MGPGHHGELCIKGPAVTPDVDSGWFNTGDVAFYDDNDFFYVVDRIKEIIIYRGAKVKTPKINCLFTQCNIFCHEYFLILTRTIL